LEGEPGVGKSTALAHVLSRTCALWGTNAPAPSNMRSAASSDPADVLAGRVVAYHICQWNVSETLSPQSFVSYVASQLCRSVSGFATAFVLMPPRKSGDDSAVKAMDRVLSTMTTVAPPQHALSFCILIDSLDEAATVAPATGNIIDLLAHRSVSAALLKSPVRIFATTRPDASVLTRLSHTTSFPV
jgi:hypothetical protein